jgi:hypothetical protein
MQRMNIFSSTRGKTHGKYDGCKGFVEEKKKGYLLFVVIFWLLQQGQPFANFETMNFLFQFLKVKHTPKKH